jgi:hypothetical protein
LSEAPRREVKEFLPVKDPADARHLIQEAATTLSAAMVWTTQQREVFHSHLTAYDEKEKKIRVWIPKEVNPAEFAKNMAERHSKQCYFSISLLRANIFFQAEFLGWDRAGMSFREPAKVFKVQRRADVRLPLGESRMLKVIFGDPALEGDVLTKRVLDLSASGMSFVISDKEEALFHPGLELKRLSFSLNSRAISCTAEVRSMNVLPIGAKPPGVRVGIRFKTLRAADQQFIAAYVFEETRKLYQVRKEVLRT